MKKAIICMAVFCIAVSSVFPCMGQERMEKHMDLLFSREDILELIPFNIDVEEAETKGLAENGQLNEDYLKLYSFYTQAFWEYLKDQIDLPAFDQGLGNDPLRFIPKSAKYHDVYQRNMSFGMTYVYLRNHFCIERLSPDELAKLQNFLTDAPDESAVKDFVADTYKTVILLDPAADSAAKYIYDLGTGSVCPNLCLMLGVATGLELGSDGKMLSVSHEKEKKAYLDDLSVKLAREIEMILEIPVVVEIN